MIADSSARRWNFADDDNAVRGRGVMEEWKRMCDETMSVSSVLRGCFAAHNG